MVTARHTSPVACSGPAGACSDLTRGGEHAENPHSLAGTGALREGCGSGVGLAAMVGGVALAGPALAGALAHVYSKLGVCQRPRQPTILAIVSYYRLGGDLEFVSGRPDQKAEQPSRLRETHPTLTRGVFHGKSTQIDAS